MRLRSLRTFHVLCLELSVSLSYMSGGEGEFANGTKPRVALMCFLLPLFFVLLG